MVVIEFIQNALAAIGRLVRLVSIIPYGMYAKHDDMKRESSGIKNGRSVAYIDNLVLLVALRIQRI